MGTMLRVSVWQPVYRVDDAGKHTLAKKARCSECKRIVHCESSTPPVACPHCGVKNVSIPEGGE